MSENGSQPLLKHALLFKAEFGNLGSVGIVTRTTSAALLQLSAMPDITTPRLPQSLAGPLRQYAREQLEPFTIDDTWESVRAVSVRPRLSQFGLGVDCKLPHVELILTTKPRDDV